MCEPNTNTLNMSLAKVVLFAKRSLHTESEISVQNFCRLKNKYDLMLCQSRLLTASETFVRQKNIRIRFDFLCFCIRGKNFDRNMTKKNNRKTHSKISGLMQCNGLYTQVFVHNTSKFSQTFKLSNLNNYIEQYCSNSQHALQLEIISRAFHLEGLIPMP